MIQSFEVFQWKLNKTRVIFQMEIHLNTFLWRVHNHKNHRRTNLMFFYTKDWRNSLLIYRNCGYHIWENTEISPKTLHNQFNRSISIRLRIQRLCYLGTSAHNLFIQWNKISRPLKCVKYLASSLYSCYANHPICLQFDLFSLKRGSVNCA